MVCCLIVPVGANKPTGHVGRLLLSQLMSDPKRGRGATKDIDELTDQFEVLGTSTLAQEPPLVWQDHFIVGIWDGVAVAGANRGDGSLYVRELEEWATGTISALENSAGLAYTDKIPLVSGCGNHVAAYSETGHFSVWDRSAGSGSLLYQDRVLWNGKVVVPNAIAVGASVVVISFSPSEDRSIILLFSIMSKRFADNHVVAPPGTLSIAVDPLNPVAFWGTSQWGLFSLNTAIPQFATAILALDWLVATGYDLDDRDTVGYGVMADAYRSALVKFCGATHSPLRGPNVEADKIGEVLRGLITKLEAVVIKPVDASCWCHHISHVGTGMSMVSETKLIVVDLEASDRDNIVVFPVPQGWPAPLSSTPFGTGVAAVFGDRSLRYLSPEDTESVFLTENGPPENRVRAHEQRSVENKQQ